MANCPSCGKHLRITDYRPECPHCGVNLNYFNANENLLDEAEKAEKEHARFQPKVDRGKASFFGSPFAIARIVLTFLPIGALFLPLCRLVKAEGTVSVNALKLVDFIKTADIGSLLNGAVVGDMLSLSLVCLLLGVVLIPVSLLLIFMALGKHAKIRVPIVYGLFFAFPLASAITFSAFAKSLPDAASAFADGCSSASLGVGAFVYLALTLMQFALNVYLTVKPIPVKYTQCYIGGLPSEEFFELEARQTPLPEIRRKMLVALTRLQLEDERERENAQTDKEVV